ncbi:MAG: hypothetical protein LUQ31_06735 [Methanoregula sp.]|nr:hypothetical protein [Methanoregula sp.]
MKAANAQSVLIFFLLFAALIFPAAFAADITITSDKTDYYFGLGEAANMALPVSNTYGHDVDGTLQFTTTEQLQNSGTVMTSTKNRVYTTTIPAGNWLLNISAGTSSVPKTMKIDVAFQYTDSSAVQVTLPEIIVHFVQDPSSSSNSQGSSVTSTSGAASSGFGSSSVQIVQQSASVQQQAGRDSGMSQSSSSDLQNNQMSQDTSALKTQLQQEAAQKQQTQNDFALNLSADPLVRQVNETLAADGFTRQSVNANPTSSTDGSFAMSYQNAAGDQIAVQGTMTGGIVPSLTEQSAAALNVTAPLTANATYRSYTDELAGKGYQRNQTIVNQTLSGATVNVTYLSEQGKPAYVNATVEQGNVTQVSLAIDQTEMNYLLVGLVIALIILLAFCGWVIYRRKARQKIVPKAAAPPRPAPVPLDYKKEALRLLAEAEAAFAREEYRDAYGLAGRAARVFLSYEHGDRRELTNAELGPVLAASGNREESGEVLALLERCSDVEFAKGFPQTGEFEAMVKKIRGMVTSG